ncbi:MAG: alpha/beta hydrolase [Candidatus Brocadiia bacterium]
MLEQQQVYKTVAGMDLTVDVFRTSAAEADRPRPAIAFFHGGGWVFGDPGKFHGACRRYAEKGLVTFSFQYRLSRREDGSYPRRDITPVESVKDARSAMRWLRQNAESLGIDPHRIVAGGQSAGGQLALSTALIDGINEDSDPPEVSPVPDALLLYSSSVNTVEAWVDWILGDRRDEIWSISPFHHLRSGMPPTIAFHGREDRTVAPYIHELFQQRMAELGNPYELVWYEGRGHGLGEGDGEYGDYFDEEILERTDAFLAEAGFLQ